MNKREYLSLGIFLVTTFLLGVVLFSGMDSDVTIKLENGKTVSSKIPASYSLLSVVVLMLLSGIASVSLGYYVSDLSKRITFSHKQETSLAMLDGDSKRVYQYVLEHENCLQKDLVYELGISKASVTRILDKLSDKNIVERVSYGKTNKVRAK